MLCQPKVISLQKNITKLGINYLNNIANNQFKNTNQANYEKQIERFEKEFTKVNKILSNLNVEISKNLLNEIASSFDIVIKMKLQKEEDKENARIEREKIKEEQKLEREVNQKLEKINKEVEKYKLRLSDLEKNHEKKRWGQR